MATPPSTSSSSLQSGSILEVVEIEEEEEVEVEEDTSSQLPTPVVGQSNPEFLVAQEWSTPDVVYPVLQESDMADDSNGGSTEGSLQQPGIPVVGESNPELVVPQEWSAQDIEYPVQIPQEIEEIISKEVKLNVKQEVSSEEEEEEEEEEEDQESESPSTSEPFSDVAGVGRSRKAMSIQIRPPTTVASSSPESSAESLSEAEESRSIKLPKPVHLRPRQTRHHSVSWTQTPASVSASSSLLPSDPSSELMSPMTKLMPLHSSSIRLKDNFRFGSTQFISPEDQLESCFADRQIRIFIVTWNMQQMKGLPESIENLLLPQDQELVSDMYVVGTQESTPARREWEVLLQQTLGPSFVLARTVVLGIIYLNFFIRRDLIWFCSVIKTATYATRPVTAIKTKGTVGMSFTLFGSSFLFMTSHFAAHQHNVQERNSNMRKTALNLDIPSSSETEDLDVTNRFDHVFWLGDFNYRLDMDRKTADRKLSSQNYASLLREDQLTRELLKRKIFRGFSEQPIAFPPSYKFDLGTDDYDTSETLRVPSWTDRILYKSKSSGGILGVTYSSCSDLKCSDHRPVYAIFSVRLEPSSHSEGIPDTIASFNRDVYVKANQIRKKLTEQLMSGTSENTTDGLPTSPRKKGTRTTTSQFCVLL